MIAPQEVRGSLGPLVQQLQGLLEQPGVSAEVIWLRIALLQAQHAAVLRLPPAAPDPGPLLELLQEVDWTLQVEGIFNGQLRQVLERGKAEPSAVVELARRAAGSDGAEALEDLSAFWGLPAASLLFLGRALAAPSWAAKAPPGALPAEQAGPEASCCPTCGSPPAAALLWGETGSRRLCCPLCATQWAFPRTTCPFCRKTGALQTLRVASEPAGWVESCDGCHGYLKTFDRRKAADGEPPSVLVATCATLHLDLLAEAAGLRPALPYTALR